MKINPLIELWKQSGEKIVFTNGCFDIIHFGHVHYLKEAKSLGDKLVVGVNSDASVQHLKGKHRPINTLSERIKVLEAIRHIDLIITFEEDTPLQLIEIIQPDVLVKGGDYQADEIVGGKAVIQNGGEVQILSLKEGLSTSAMIESIRKT